MSLPKPYYQDSAVTLYHGDCREIVPLLGRFDAVITDPPYGVGLKYFGYDDSEENWFVLMDAIVPTLKSAANFVIMPTCQIKRIGWWYQRHSPEWMVCWHKGSPGHVSKIGFNDWEPHVCWGKPAKPMHDYFSTPCGFDGSGHPCPKPMAYTNWLVSRSTNEGQTVLDSFAGSGTTGRACKDLGRKCVMIEREEKYCEIAARRMGQEVLPLDAARALNDTLAQELKEYETRLSPTLTQEAKAALSAYAKSKEAQP